MGDAATIISTCSRLLSNPRTVALADAHAAVAACQAWLKEHCRQSQHAVVSRRSRPRLPPEILNKIFRRVPYDDDQKAVLLACSSVNKEWRHYAWPHVWKKLEIRKKTLAYTVCQFSLPWALKATNGIHVRNLAVARTQELLDYLPSLLAAPIFTGLRCLCLWNSNLNLLHLLVAFRSLPNLICLQMHGLMQERRVAWGGNLGLTEQEENEIWSIGFGNLKALCIRVETDGVMLEKVAMGLGSKLESLRMGLSGVHGGKTVSPIFIDGVSKLPEFGRFWAGMQDGRGFHSAVPHIADFLRQRGRNLQYLRLPYDSSRALAPLAKFLPNIRHFDAGGWAHWGCRSTREDVIAFLNGVRKLECLWMGGPDDIPHQVWEVAVARKVEFRNDQFQLPDYVACKMEDWMGLQNKRLLEGRPAEEKA
ncbi:hypothetical protein HK104_001060 [Borealophlyctis nickersoniae]|nr:hypothetical protein HK104_001060 [Borealophlyctis nickersoniae]